MYRLSRPWSALSSLAAAREVGAAHLALRTDTAARWFLYSAVFWLVVPGLAGLIMAASLFAPSLQELLPMEVRPYLQFGRLRAMHVNVAVFGWLSMAYAGAMLFTVPRLTGTPLFREGLARLNAVLWNVTILGAFITLPLGFNQGREYAEMVWALDILMIVNFALLATNMWGTVLRRKEPRLYISVWLFLAASTIMPALYAVGNVVWDTQGALSGVNDATLNYFYVHNVFNVWFTTTALGIYWYLIPRLSGNPLWSYRLAVWGFMTVWTGQHHLLYGPGPDWLEVASVSFSILAALPNIAFAFNFFKTMEGAWAKVASDVPLRFVATSGIFYLLTCVQGVAQSFRSFNALTHFTNWVIGHSHLAFFAAYSFLVFALIYHLLPRMLGREQPFSQRLMEWHYWLTLGGISVFMLALWAAGLVQGRDWLTGGIPFIETVRAMQPYMLLRLAGGVAIGLGVLLFVYNFWKALRGRSLAPTAQAG